jgi:hypothetical protein
MLARPSRETLGFIFSKPYNSQIASKSTCLLVSAGSLFVQAERGCIWARNAGFKNKKTSTRLVDVLLN